MAPSGCLAPQGPPRPRRQRLNADYDIVRSLGEGMWILRQKRMLTDITLLVRPNDDGSGQIELEAHKLILTAVSPVFSNLCQKQEGHGQGHGQGQRPVVVLPVGIDIVSAETFLKAVYMEKFEVGLELDILLDVALLTGTYAVGTLVPKVDEALGAVLNAQNCVRVFEAVKLFEGLKAKETSFKLIIRDIKAKLDSGEFKTWSGLLWEQILDLDYLKEVQEIDLFKALIKWRDAESPSRCAYFASLFPHIRLALIGAKDFTKVVVPTGLLSQDEIAQFYAFFTGCANSHGILSQPRNIMLAANSAELYAALETCSPGDTIQLVDAIYDGHFSVTIPQTTIRGAKGTGGGSILEFASTKGLPAIFVAPSARRTTIKHIKFVYKGINVDKGPPELVGTGIVFRYSDSVHIARNLALEGTDVAIRVYGTPKNLMAKDIVGEIVYAPA